MTTLYGTMSDGSLIPVQADSQGRLVAEGLQGAPGPQGPQGEPGIGQLPPNPVNGDILVWDNGLIWVSGFLPGYRAQTSEIVSVTGSVLTFADDSQLTGFKPGDAVVQDLGYIPRTDVITFVGGGASVSAMTGALPILNTTDDGATPTGGVRTDPLASSLKLALPGNGSNNGTTLTDVSSNAIAFSYYGAGATDWNVQARTTTESSIFYGSSVVPGDYNPSFLETYWTADDTKGAFNWGSGPFTIEFWANIENVNTSGSHYLFDRNTDTGGTRVYLYFNNRKVYFPGLTPFDFPATGWHHLALVSNGTDTTVYLDGISVAVDSGSLAVTSGMTNMVWGNYSGKTSAYALNAYVNDFRIYHAEKYTSNFDVQFPARVELTLDSTADLDNFRIGDALVQSSGGATGVIASIDQNGPMVTLSGPTGTWLADGINQGVGPALDPATGVVGSVDPGTASMTLSSSDETPPKRWVVNGGRYVVGPMTVVYNAPLVPHR